MASICAKRCKESARGVMSEKSEIIFMQVRLLRLASKEWKISLENVIDIFKKNDVFNYIEIGYGIFHCEGDDVVLDEIREFLERKGVTVNA